MSKSAAGGLQLPHVHNLTRCIRRMKRSQAKRQANGASWFKTRARTKYCGLGLADLVVQRRDLAKRQDEARDVVGAIRWGPGFYNLPSLDMGASVASGAGLGNRLAILVNAQREPHIAAHSTTMNHTLVSRALIRSLADMTIAAGKVLECLASTAANLGNGGVADAVVISSDVWESNKAIHVATSLYEGTQTCSWICGGDLGRSFDDGCVTTIETA